MLAILVPAGCGDDDSQADLATTSLVESDELPRVVIDDGDVPCGYQRSTVS